MASELNIVTLSIASRDQVDRRALSAFGGEQQGSHISFGNADLLWQVLTRKRWDVLQAMTGAGAISIREAARRVSRDVKAVHADATALIAAGIVERTAEGKIVFPYDAVHVDFVLGKAA